MRQLDASRPGLENLCRDREALCKTGQQQHESSVNLLVVVYPWINSCRLGATPGQGGLSRRMGG